MILTITQRLLLSVLSGILLSISFPFTGSATPLIFIALIPLLIVEDTVSKQRLRPISMLVYSYIAFFIYNIGTTWWIWNADVGGAWSAFILNALLMALAFQLYVFVKKHLGGIFGTLAFFTVWLGFEFCHFHWELSWPWLTFGNVFSIRTSWVQWYEYTGVLGGSLWVLGANFILFRLLLNIKKNKVHFSKRLFAKAVIVLLAPLTLSIWMYSYYEQKGIGTEVVIVQPNIDPYQKFSSISAPEQLNRICDIAEASKTDKTSFVLAPETAIARNFDEAVVNYDYGYMMLKERMEGWGGTQLFIGASTEKRFEKKRSRASRPDPLGGDGFVEYYNSSMVMGESIVKPEIIHKSKLVLGAEKVPFSSIFPFLEEMSIELGGTSGTLGVEEKPTNSQAGKFPFTPSICYESVYGEYTAKQTKLGSKAIFVITNDGWWGDTPGYKQHFSFARLRAIENRKDVARSANTGTSGIINQRGDVEQQTGFWKISAVRGNLFLNDTKTLYMKLGDVIGKLSLIFSLLLIGYATYRKIKPLQAEKSV